jgi:ABC-type oligopeptide transport system ATPase subunit
MTSEKPSLTYNLNLNAKMSSQQLAQQAKEAKQQQENMQYYTNPAKRRKIDFILEECATLMSNCEATYQARQQAKYKEQELLGEIAKIDLHFAIQCGYLIPDN